VQKHKHTRTNSGILGHFAKFATSPEINHQPLGSHTAQAPGSPGRGFQAHYRPIAARVATNLHLGSRGLLPAGAQVTESVSSRPSAAMATTMTPSEEGHIHGEERPHGHSRNRSGKSSADSSKARAPKPPSQKAMLSRALQKANSAVLLDNNQDFRGARQAYAEACELLHQVLQRTSGDEDKRKLEAIVRHSSPSHLPQSSLPLFDTLAHFKSYSVVPTAAELASWIRCFPCGTTASLSLPIRTRRYQTEGPLFNTHPSVKRTRRQWKQRLSEGSAAKTIRLLTQ
jgi:hypothetical protein